MRLVLLWFGSWKNSMSCYAPAWVKRDAKRFPRTADQDGTPQEMLSPFSAANRDADARAFAALMRHLRETDGARHTVLMVQVENEIGMIPTARDHGAAAEARLRRRPSPPSSRAISQLTRTSSPPSCGRACGLPAESAAAPGRSCSAPGRPPRRSSWRGTSRATPRPSPPRASAEYPLPMFVNAALIRPGHQPGQYPSGGPLPHLFDVWRAAAPSIDFLSPDIYFQNFAEWARRYARSGNPLFIPEALRSAEASVNGLYALGALDAIGFAPFGIESIAEPAAAYLAASLRSRRAARAADPRAPGQGCHGRAALGGRRAEAAPAGPARRLRPARHVRARSASGAGRRRRRNGGPRGRAAALGRPRARARRPTSSSSRERPSPSRSRPPHRASAPGS